MPIRPVPNRRLLHGPDLAVAHPCRLASIPTLELLLSEELRLTLWSAVLLTAVPAVLVGLSPTWRRLGLAVLVGLGLIAAEVVVLAPRLDSFGVIHLFYLNLVVAVPLTALVLGLRWLARSRATGVVLLAVAVMLTATGVHASFVEPNRFRVETATLDVGDHWSGEGEITVAVLADIQTDSVEAYERRVVATVMAEQPDVIVLPGDVHQQVDPRRDETADLRDLLSELSAPGGVWLTKGDVDDEREMALLTDGTGVRRLDGQGVQEVEVRGRRVALAGIDVDYRSNNARQVIEELGQADPGAAKVLVSHRPDAVEHLRGVPVDLVVAGHTHGGQVQLPGIGPLTIASGVPMEVGAGGLHELPGGTVYVSRGIGMERGQAPPMRFLTPPEVSFLTLR